MTDTTTADSPLSGLRVAFLTESLPSPKTHGSEIVSSCFVESLLALGCRLTVVGHQRVGPYYDRIASWELPIGRIRIETRYASLGEKLRWIGGALLHDLPITSAKYRNRHYLDAVRRLIGETDLVVVDHTQMYWCEPLIRGRAHAVVIHNHESRIYYDLARAQRNPLKRLILDHESRQLHRLERHIDQGSAAIWGLADKDLQDFRHPVQRFDPYSFLVPLPAKPRTALYQLGMLGMWTWKPNQEALVWFIDEVLPLLPPEVVVAVAGNGVPSWIKPTKNLRLIGFTDSVSGFFAQCQAIAIPALHDVGIQVKSIDALALGIPVIGTQMAFRGIPQLPAHGQAAMDAADFARLVCATLRSPTDLQPVGADSWNGARKALFSAQLERSVRALLNHQPE